MPDLIKTLEQWVRNKRMRAKTRHVADYPGGLVLDVGCGQFPFPAHVYADVDISNRPDDAHFVVADVQRLPFRSSAFAFVHCSNVLEHVEYPGQGYSELQRVGKHGYAECPAWFRENVICHTGAHLWVIHNREGSLEYEKPRQTLLFGKRVLPITWCYYLLSKKPTLWKVFEFLLDDILHVQFVRFHF
jgi:SAM-dependent methyltransferase